MELFPIQRVYDYLAHQFWWRWVSQNGQISLGGHRYGIDIAHAGEDIRLEFEADTAHFVARTTKGVDIKRLPPKQLTPASITGLNRNPD